MSEALISQMINHSVRSGSEHGMLEIDCDHIWYSHGHGYQCFLCNHYTGMDAKINELIEKYGKIVNVDDLPDDTEWTEIYQKFEIAFFNFDGECDQDDNDYQKRRQQWDSFRQRIKLAYKQVRNDFMRTVDGTVQENFDMWVKFLTYFVENPKSAEEENNE